MLFNGFLAQTTVYFFDTGDARPRPPWLCGLQYIHGLYNQKRSACWPFVGKDRQPDTGNTEQARLSLVQSMPAEFGLAQRVMEPVFAVRPEFCLSWILGFYDFPIIYRPGKIGAGYFSSNNGRVDICITMPYPGTPFIDTFRHD